ncbi:MAG: ribonuclease Z [Candidatus Micrarchaeia archaeon]|jgi:ribonuclease BN (tRNA processing enzyme)
MKTASKGADGTRAGRSGGKMKRRPPGMKIFFLGTNGWFATKTGNTVCAAISFHGRLIVLDAGDGFSKLPALMARLGVRRADVFLSHVHLDHAGGLHALLLMPSRMRVRIFVHKSYLPALKRLVAHPYTASAGEQWAKVSICPLSAGENLLPYSVRVLPLDHKDPCFGFRFSLNGREIAYCTDTGPCKNYMRLASGADLLITESTLPSGARPVPAWPHLSPEMAAAEAKKAAVGRLILTHFDAKQPDGAALRSRAQSAARKIFLRTTAARDGMEIEA